MPIMKRYLLPISIAANEWPGPKKNPKSVFALAEHREAWEQVRDLGVCVIRERLRDRNGHKVLEIDEEGVSTAAFVDGIAILQREDVMSTQFAVYTARVRDAMYVYERALSGARGDTLVKYYVHYHAIEGSPPNY